MQYERLKQLIGNNEFNGWLDGLESAIKGNNEKAEFFLGKIKAAVSEPPRKEKESAQCYLCKGECHFVSDKDKHNLWDRIERFFSPEQD